MNPTPKLPLIAIVGPTASGKSELAVHLATELKTSIISVDSRQIYRGMDIGTGKVSLSQNNQDQYIYKNIVHYGLNITEPETPFSVTQFQEYVWPIIEKLNQEHHVPVLCGGTAHWMDAVINHQNFPEVSPNQQLRINLEKLTAPELYNQLQKIDNTRAKTIDPHNKHRLIRAIEIATTIGTNPIKHKSISPYNTLWIGIKPRADLTDKINSRLQERLNRGLIAEVKNLHNKLSWQQLEQFGLEYRFSSFYLQGLMNHQEFVTRLQFAIRQYAKRQMTWWKRNPNIHWIENEKQSLELIRKFTNTSPNN